MADTTKKTAAATAAETELVPLLIPLDPNPKAPKEEFISCNFKNYLIQKGKTVLVPPEVKEGWDNAQKAKMEAYEYVEANLVREPN